MNCANCRGAERRLQISTLFSYTKKISIEKVCAVRVVLFLLFLVPKSGHYVSYFALVTSANTRSVVKQTLLASI